MLKFKLLLWMLQKLLNRTIRRNPDAAAHVAGKDLVFQIRTVDGTGRFYHVANGRVASTAGIHPGPAFTLTFADASTGFRILSARDGKSAFLQALPGKELVISGDFVAVMWFQALTDFLNAAKPAQDRRVRGT